MLFIFIEMIQNLKKNPNEKLVSYYKIYLRLFVNKSDALNKSFENAFRFGSTVVRSFELVIPNHSATPFQSDSHGVVGTTTPSNTSGPSFVMSEGNDPRILPPSTDPEATK